MILKSNFLYLKECCFIRYFEVNGLDASRRVGYGQFNTDHTATIDLFDTEEEKMEHMRGMYKTSPKAFAEWKEWCMYVHLLTDIFGTLEDPKEFDEEKLFAED